MTPRTVQMYRTKVNIGFLIVYLCTFFSFHELGKYDLPATIDYILNKTGQSTLFYIGHSMGTTAFFTLASVRPEYNKKVKLMQAFGPAAFFVGNLSTSVKILRDGVPMLLVNQKSFYFQINLTQRTSPKVSRKYIIRKVIALLYKFLSVQMNLKI